MRDNMNRFQNILIFTKNMEVYCRKKILLLLGASIIASLLHHNQEGRVHYVS